MGPGGLELWGFGACGSMFERLEIVFEMRLMNAFFEGCSSVIHLRDRFAEVDRRSWTLYGDFGLFDFLLFAARKL